MASAYYLSKQCFAYKRLKQQIGQQCMVYSKLRKNGELGSIPGMYETTKDGRWIPAETGAAPLLRGGIVTTMASFEAFLQDLLEEALDNMKYKRHDADLDVEQKHYTCPKCKNSLGHEHLFDKNNDKRPYLPDSAEEKDQLSDGPIPRMHIWSKQYTNSLIENPLKKIPKLGTKNLMNDIANALKAINSQMTTVQTKSSEVKERLKQPNPDDQSEQKPDEVATTLNNAHKLLDDCDKAAATASEFMTLHDTMKTILASDSFKIKFKRNPLTFLINPDPKTYHATDEFILKLFEDGPMNYHYLIDEKWASHMEIDSGYIICLLLRLFYGFRCIIGHGNSEKTLKGEKATLNDFPECSKCHGDMLPTEISDIYRLSTIYDKCIEQQGKDKVLKTARKLPKTKPIKNLGIDTAIAKEGLELLKKSFPNNDVVEWEDGRYSEKAPLHENYALFHLFRVHHWLEESPIEAYVTYHMLVRMNQFVLLLAHRMRFAVAKIMMDQPNALVEDGIWGVPKDETKRKAKIRRFEEKHLKRIKKIQKLTSCQN